MALYGIEGNVWSSQSAMAQLRAFGYESRGKKLIQISSREYAIALTAKTMMQMNNLLEGLLPSQLPLSLWGTSTRQKSTGSINTAGTTLARRFLTNLEDNFMNRS